MDAAFQPPKAKAQPSTALAAWAYVAVHFEVDFICPNSFLSYLLLLCDILPYSRWGFNQGAWSAGKILLQKAPFFHILLQYWGIIPFELPNIFITALVHPLPLLQPSHVFLRYHQLPAHRPICQNES